MNEIRPMCMTCDRLERSYLKVLAEEELKNDCLSFPNFTASTVRTALDVSMLANTPHATRNHYSSALFARIVYRCLYTSNMDANYLKLTVNEAVSEALAAMAVGVPEDKVEYIARYLKAYCARKRAQSKLAEECGDVEAKYAREQLDGEQEKIALQAKADAKTAHTDALTDFLMGLESSCTTKQEVMDKVCKFTAEHLKVPACYIGVKKVINEVETLYYYSANDEVQGGKIVGQKLTPPAGEGEDDAPKRQGLSFEAFKVPEVEPVEPPEDAPEDWAPPPPPGPQPVVVDNCMRDTRCKFYGIPKLGSFLAVPVVYNTSDHTEGILQGEAPVPEAVEPAEPVEGAEGEEAPAPVEPKAIWLPQKTVSASLILCLDTIGDYRSFAKGDIETAKMIGEKMVTVFEALDTAQFNAQATFLDAQKENSAAVAELLAALAAVEAEVVAAQEEALKPAEVEEGAEAPPPMPETTKALKIAYPVAQAIHAKVSTELAEAINGLAGHVLPATPAVTNLMYATAALAGIGANAKDAYGEITWECIRTGCMPTLLEACGAKIDAWVAGQGDRAALDEVKAFIEANAVLPGEFPPACVACQAVSLWLTKAIAAFDAQVAEDAFIAAANAPPAEEE